MKTIVRHITRITLCGFVLILVCLDRPEPGYGDNGDTILGTWQTADNRGMIEIFACNQKTCGRIVSLSEPLYPAHDSRGMAGKPRVDRNNPDSALRQRPVMGLVLLQDFTYSGNRCWKSGTIYDPESGNTYKGQLTLESADQLKVRGYIGIPLFGRTTVWRRINE